MYDYLIVGAGFAGSVLAERLAGVLNKKVLILDKRDHIGGNAYDYYDEAGILVHKYGPHIFHTNCAEVFKYLSNFTKWRNYEHKVLASVDGQLVPIPINLNTVNKLYGMNMNSFEMDEFLKSKAECREDIVTSEDFVLNKIGKELYEKFFKNYTRKQWGLDPSELKSSVAARIPVRNNCDDRYFTDKFQSMPLYGYTEMFRNMLKHPNINILLNTDYKDIQNFIPYKKMIFTGPIDEYFNYEFGKLPYRSIDFISETYDMEKFQPTGTVNYPNEQLYTRITEMKYLTGQKHNKTSVIYEIPSDSGDPFYPVPKPENNEIYKKYASLTHRISKKVLFTGRLASYKYYNMDQVIAQSLSLFKKIRENEVNMTLDIKEILKVQKYNGNHVSQSLEVSE